MTVFMYSQLIPSRGYLSGGPIPQVDRMRGRAGMPRPRAHLALDVIAGRVLDRHRLQIGSPKFGGMP